MRLSILATLILALAAGAQESSTPPVEPPWQTALQADPDALEAARELKSILAAGDLGALARHFPESRLRLLLRDVGVKDGLYGRLQARALLAAWMVSIENREPRITLAVPQADGLRLSLLFQWPPSSPEDLSPLRQLVCELSYSGDGWILEEAVAP